MSGVAVPNGLADSGLPWDTFGTTIYDSYTGGKNPPIPNEIIEIAIPKSAFGMPTTTNIQSAITYGNRVIKLESVTPIPEFVTLAIPVISLLRLVFYMRMSKDTQTITLLLFPLSLFSPLFPSSLSLIIQAEAPTQLRQR